MFFTMMEEYSRWFSMSRFDKPMRQTGKQEGIVPVPDENSPDYIGRLKVELTYYFEGNDCYAMANLSDKVSFNIHYKREWKTFIVKLELNKEFYESPLGEFCTTISGDYEKNLRLKLTELIDKVEEYAQIVHFLSKFARQKEAQPTE